MAYTKLKSSIGELKTGATRLAVTRGRSKFSESSVGSLGRSGRQLTGFEQRHETRFIENRDRKFLSLRKLARSRLTTDHDWLAAQLERVKIGLIEDGTAIGDGLGVALTRLDQAKRETAGKRQGAFVILMTDGANNRGALSPTQAADLAKSRNIPIYAIGAGKDGYVPMPVFDANNRRIGRRMVLSDLDEAALRIISEQTGGKFFRASDIDTTEAAFKAIDGAKKLRFESKTKRARELFPWLVSGSLGLLLAGGLLAYTPWRREALT